MKITRDVVLIHDPCTLLAARGGFTSMRYRKVSIIACTHKSSRTFFKYQYCSYQDTVQVPCTVADTKSFKLRYFSPNFHPPHRQEVICRQQCRQAGGFIHGGVRMGPGVLTVHQLFRKKWYHF